MATRRAHRGGSVLFRWTQQLWLLVLAGLLTTHVMTAAASVQTPTTVKAVGDTVSTPDADTAYPLMGAGSPTQGKISSDENENLFRLRNAIAAADATETEKLTDSRFLYVCTASRTRTPLGFEIEFRYTLHYSSGVTWFSATDCDTCISHGLLRFFCAQLRSRFTAL